jgi:hypothetical protein
VLWLIALGAGAAAWRDSPIRRLVFALVPIALMTQVLFPFLYAELLTGDAVAVIVLAIRNLLVLVTGAAALTAVARDPTATGTSSSPNNEG